MKKKKVKGFITVEFALLIPVILLIYTVLFCAVLYWYDECILQTNMYLLCMESLEQQGSTQKLAFVKDKQRQLYNEKYILVSELESSYRIQKNELHVSSTGNLPKILKGIDQSQKTWELYAQSSVKVSSAADILRLCREGIELWQNFVPEEGTHDS